MKFCYVDESGNGSEPFLIMVGMVVDAKRMHRTKSVWDEFLVMLRKITGKRIHEFHASDFYSGGGVWRGIDGSQRAKIISAILAWWSKRKHKLTYTVIDKAKHKQNKQKGTLPIGLETYWRVAAIHIILSLQKAHQKEPNNKGHTLFLFDKQEKEEKRLSAFVSDPPDWINKYYSVQKGQPLLDQVVDVPFFCDSKEVLLIQVADLICFIIRRYTEIKEGRSKPDYKDEMKKLTSWMQLIKQRSYPSSIRWPIKGLNDTQKVFNELVPLSIRTI